jgi:hypothetical protein
MKQALGLQQNKVSRLTQGVALGWYDHRPLAFKEGVAQPHGSEDSCPTPLLIFAEMFVRVSLDNP